MASKTSDAAARVRPAKFAHAVLRTNKFKEMVEWYRTVLEADVVFSNEMLAFMTYDDEHHRIAIAGFPGLVDRPRHSVGLDHLAYTYANLGDLIATYERLKAAGITPAVTINHGPTTSMYYRDPDGNRVELQIDNFASVEELNAWFRSGEFRKNPIGTTYDADELARQHHAGVPLETLLSTVLAGGADSSMIARLVE